MTGITCGHCSTRETKVRHATVAEVRECASFSRRGSVPQTLPTKPLLPDLNANPYVIANREDRARRAGNEGVRTTVPQTLVTVPAARYAIGPEDATEFYRVDRPTEGRWAGYVFVKRQAGDDLFPVKDRRTRDGILATIARDVEGALLRYGREIGACGHCGRTLTNAESREAGIGPVCREKWAA